ncbi:LysM peptidoglycan-binding domain-containing protein [Eubacterium sp. MSJ-33]|uniref:LysM peptidoglycan-binding domain-containing protein n=1 Tax=Eubacterium sp. MSJ-33 TaxID=2841528 RepID=UPI001C77B07B|nr:LysM peptidoglycan-binding domain-containing protein [Eubacterium sp. MSJ-33]QWT51852.1 LysM peptidoglycan-binding domain-containing protein [Eubacterium sp. MSJ-33]
MIEIIYDKDKDKEKQGTSEKNEHEVSVNLRLPKNIRQIGNPDGHKRIYMEDYVVTYLNYIARPGSTQARGAILLGESKKSDMGDVIFISGAVDAQNIEFDMDESEFTQEAWTTIYDQVKQFFPGLSVMGWFLSRMGFSTAVNDKIEKMHVENFPGKDKVLFITDSLESEDAFYMYEQGQLVKQKGYYIYYEKNEAMQNYIMKQKGDVPLEQTEIQRKDEEIVRQFRRKNKDLPENKDTGVGFVYIASSFVVLALLAMGITIVSNYDKMKKMEVSINRLEVTADTAVDSDYVEAMATTEIPSATGMDAANGQATTEAILSAPTEQVVPDATENTGITETVTTESALPVAADQEQYYIIQDGDSLSSIAFTRYGDADLASKIAEANDIGIDDNIFVGQKILLPNME